MARIHPRFPREKQVQLEARIAAVAGLVLALCAGAICCAIFAGCTTVLSEARTMPDGTKSLSQKVIVTSGGKLESGMLDFSAESVAADGSNWNVKSGTDANGAEANDQLKNLVELLRLVNAIGAAPVP